jgi:hypothetical protein
MPPRPRFGRLFRAGNSSIVETAARVEAARRTRGLTTVSMAADLPKVTNAATKSSMFRLLRGSATPSDVAVQRAANVFAPALRHIPRTRYAHLPATRDVTGIYTLDTLNPTHFHEMSIDVASELCAAKGWRELLTRFWVAVLANPSKTGTAATKPKASSSPSGVQTVAPANPSPGWAWATVTAPGLRTDRGSRTLQFHCLVEDNTRVSQKATAWMDLPLRALALGGTGAGDVG